MSTVEQTTIKKVPKLELSVVTGEQDLPVKAIDGLRSGSESHYEKFLRSVMDQKKDYPLPIPIANLKQKGVEIPVLTQKSFSLWQGKQKSKKTTVLALMIASLISNRQDDEIGFTGLLDGVVVFFDTEQGESYAARTMKLILKLAGLEYSDKLIYCDLREFSPAERTHIIEAGITNTPNVKLVVIDGLVDLLTDFMDAGQGHVSITEILKWCSQFDIHIAGVLHQNKNDKNARAHVGTISSQKCEVEISTEVDPDDRSQSLVTCVNSRGIPFEPFAIRWEKGSLPCINQEWNKSIKTDLKIERDIENKKDLAANAFKPFVALQHKDAVDSIIKTSGVGLTTAKTRLKELVALEFVLKGADDLYRLNIDKVKGQSGSNPGQLTHVKG